jgi:4'-phosphopantetheinyl transferase
MNSDFPPPPLLPRELHVWRVELDRPPAADVLAGRLSAEERRRAERFVREIDRRRFLVGHAALRTILGRYLDIPPHRVETVLRAGGKPELLPSQFSPRPLGEGPGVRALAALRFNLSHSEALALIAVALDCEVGVDVEHVRPIDDVESIVKRYFAPGEQAAWRALPERERLGGFFRCWTRKEAYLKARGIGLSGGLDRFEVSLAPDEPPRLLQVADPSDAAARWQMYDVPAGQGYLAACVVEGVVEKLSLFDWECSPITHEAH